MSISMVVRMQPNFSQHIRLYGATFINTLGSWMTFLAISLVVTEKYGAANVATVFLAQTVPPVLLSSAIAKMVPPGLRGRAYGLTQVALALNSLILVGSQNLILIYSHLVIGSTLRTLSAPLFQTLVGETVGSNDLNRVHSRIAALQAGTLALAPMIGVWVKMTLGTPVLFALDAVTFLVALVLVPEFWRASMQLAQPQPGAALSQGMNASKDRPRPFRSLLATFAPAPGNLPAPIRTALRHWFLFIAAGALLNAIEFPAFVRAGMAEKGIGNALAAWGAGSLLALVVPGVKATAPLLAFAYFGFMVALTAFPSSLAVIVAFAAGGYVSAVLAGNLRSRLQSSVPKGYDALRAWAHANQVTQGINLAAYGGAGLLLTTVGFVPFGLVAAAACLLLVADLLVRKAV